jgi:hypothetical protein
VGSSVESAVGEADGFDVGSKVVSAVGSRVEPQ